ncbi:hypothetical protein [Vagococcus sp. WN89Y]|uniref:hypothetical protein n=1 Tax=Vagococcus sp. WN89Y TaxID=3457258 RepID=UPI003FCD547A
MKVNTRVSSVPLLLLLFSCIIPFYPDLRLPLYHGELVAWIEGAQALWLLFGALFTGYYLQQTELPDGARRFWRWSVIWWLVLFGRSISWGRDYFPEGPKLLFRAISVVLIGALVLYFLLSPTLRKELAWRLRHEALPLWTFALVVVTFIISDSVEHHRFIAPLFLHDTGYQDLIEELYEIPFMVGLFCVSYDLMQRQK